MIGYGNNKCKAFAYLNGYVKLKKGYVYEDGAYKKIYSSGNIVTYMVDSGVSYQEEVDEGASCLSPKTFTPTKSGWTFAGWREDKTANGSVLTNKVMGDAPVTLYAVFKQDVTLSFWDGTKTVTQTYTRYYNGSGSLYNPTVAIWQVAVSGWNYIGFTTSSAANGSITHQNGAVITMDGNKTFYARYNRTLTCRFDGGGATGGGTATASGVQDRGANGAVTSVRITMPQCGYSRNGYYFQGWSYGSQVLQPGNVITITDSTYATATWTAISFYAIQNGKLVQCPNASAWHGGYNCGSGEISDGGTNFYGGAGHTGGDVDQSWGADTGNIDTKGCANVQIDGYVNIWGSNTFGASLQVWGNGQLILDTWESNAIKNINISAYSTVRVRINAGISWMDDKDAWVNVGFKNIRFYT